MKRWAWRRTLNAVLALASLVMALAIADATVLVPGRIAGAAHQVLTEPAGEAAASGTLAGLLVRAGLDEATADADALSSVTNPGLLGALAGTASTGDGSALPAAVTAAVAGADPRLAELAARLPGVATGLGVPAQASAGLAAVPVAGPRELGSLLSLRTRVLGWMVVHRAEIIGYGSLIVVSGLALLFVFSPSRRATCLRRVAVWALVTAGLPLALAYVAAPVVLARQPAPVVSLVAIALPLVLHGAVPLLVGVVAAGTLTLVASFFVGFAVRMPRLSRKGQAAEVLEPPASEVAAPDGVVPVGSENFNPWASVNVSPRVAVAASEGASVRVPILGPAS